jgi:predicted phosphodiesterase
LRIIVFSDIHGNPYACQAVLQAIRKEGECDAVAAAGDLCLGGSDPGACVDMLAESGVQAVFGNTEEYLFCPDQVPPDQLHKDMWDRVHPVALWVLKKLSRDHMNWLKALPFELKYQPSSPKNGGLQVVHANPSNNELMILPAEMEQKMLWEEIRQPDDDPEMASVLSGVKAEILAFGHFHYTFERMWGDLRLVDVAPCSMPGVDFDPRARYTIFTHEEDKWYITRKWVTYDSNKELGALERSDMPFKEVFIRYFK